MNADRYHDTFETVRFDSNDGLRMTADLYPVDSPKSLIVLCHRSHCNRGEYRATAPRLTQRGYACLAIDQCSGMKVFGVTNETSARAKEHGRATGYLDAQQDIEAAVEYAFQLNGNAPIILLGSSYSASLALLIATQTDKIKAAIAFSPGEHLKGVRVGERLAALQQPLFATGAKHEIPSVREVVRLVKAKNLTVFEPTVDGSHGSKTLWASVAGHETYWDALERFLSQL